MPAKRKKERVVSTYFVWLVGQRDGVYYADGRSNNLPAGRHSLGTKDRDAALEALKKLDLHRAVDLGLADRALLSTAQADWLDLEEGRQLYMKHVGRPTVVGGARPVTAKRYRAVFDKFLAFAKEEGVSSWNQVTRRTLDEYAAYLDGEHYAYATQYLELTTLKQAFSWLIDEKHLKGVPPIVLPLAKPKGTTTYCWHQEEVQAMVEFCRVKSELKWLHDVIVILACTGLRISELASLRMTDVDWDKNQIHLTDESQRPRRDNTAEVRQTKSGRSRSLPIHDWLHPILRAVDPLKDGRVCHGPLGGRLKPDTVRRILMRDVLTPLSKKFPKKPGADGFEEGRLHSFRHYFCSACANSGIPEPVVMTWLGHSDSRMVRHYFHLHDNIASVQMNRVRFVGEVDGSVAVNKGS